MLSSNSGRRVGVLISYVYTVVQIVVQLIYIPILLSCIGQSEYGIYQLIGSVTAYIVSINGVLAAGVGRYYCMYMAEGDKLKMENTLAIAKRMYLVMSVVTMVVMGALTVVFRSVYAASFTIPQLDECCVMLLVLGVNCIVTMNNTINISILTANERFLFLKGTQLLSLVLQPVIVVLLTRVFPYAVAICAVVLGLNILCATAQRMYSKNVLNASWEYHGWDRSLAKGLLGFSVSVVLVTIADQVFWKTDQLIVGFMYGPEQVAVYSVGAQVYSAYMYIGIAIASVFLPHVSELYHRDHDMDAISDLFIKVGRLTFMVCIAVLGGFAVLGPDFMTLWAGEGYFDSYLIAIVVMVPFTIDIVQNLGLTILQVVNKYYFRGVMYLLIAIANVALTIVLLNAVGLVGAALSTAVAMLVGNGIIMNWYYQRRVGLDILRFWREIGRLASVAFPVAAIFALLYWNLPIRRGTWMGLVVSAFFYLVILVVVLWRFGLNEYEKGLFSGFARNAKDLGHRK